MNRKLNISERIDLLKHGELPGGKVEEVSKSIATKVTPSQFEKLTAITEALKVTKSEYIGQAIDDAIFKTQIGFVEAGMDSHPVVKGFPLDEYLEGRA